MQLERHQCLEKQLYSLIVLRTSQKDNLELNGDMTTAGSSIKGIAHEKQH